MINFKNYPPTTGRDIEVGATFEAFGAKFGPEATAMAVGGVILDAVGNRETAEQIFHEFADLEEFDAEFVAAGTTAINEWDPSVLTQANNDQIAEQLVGIFGGRLQGGGETA